MVLRRIQIRSSRSSTGSRRRIVREDVPNLPSFMSVSRCTPSSSIASSDPEEVKLSSRLTPSRLVFKMEIEDDLPRESSLLTLRKFIMITDPDLFVAKTVLFCSLLYNQYSLCEGLDMTEGRFCCPLSSSCTTTGTVYICWSVCLSLTIYKVWLLTVGMIVY